MKHLVALSMLLPALATAQTAQRPACDAPEQRQFDFWIGRWQVTTPDGKTAGRNVITPVAGGCALHEDWTGRGGFTGQSLNGWHRGRWHQTWIDSTGGRLELSGNLQGASMVLEGRQPRDDKPGMVQLHRITWTPQADGSVRQHWQSSDDEGKSWQTAFDGRYAKER